MAQGSPESLKGVIFRIVTENAAAFRARRMKTGDTGSSGIQEKGMGKAVPVGPVAAIGIDPAGQIKGKPADDGIYHFVGAPVDIVNDPDTDPVFYAFIHQGCPFFPEGIILEHPVHILVGIEP